MRRSASAVSWQNESAQHFGEVALEDRIGAYIGLLQVDAPVFQLFQRDRDPGDGAAHERARPHDAEIAVEEPDLGFPRHGRRAIVALEHRETSVTVTGSARPATPKHP